MGETSFYTLQKISRAGNLSRDHPGGLFRGTENRNRTFPWHGKRVSGRQPDFEGVFGCGYDFMAGQAEKPGAPGLSPFHARVKVWIEDAAEGAALRPVPALPKFQITQFTKDSIASCLKSPGQRGRSKKSTY